MANRNMLTWPRPTCGVVDGGGDDDDDEEDYIGLRRKIGHKSIRRQ